METWAVRVAAPLDQAEPNQWQIKWAELMSVCSHENDVLVRSSQRNVAEPPNCIATVIRPKSSEEFFNSITHGLGLVLGIAGFVALMVAAVRHGGTWPIVGCAIYGSTLVALYCASTMSHVFQSPQQRRYFRMLDQGCIYLFIAGTYTPLTVVLLRDGWWWLLAAVWTVALAGFCSKVFWAHRVDAVSTSGYLLLGWVPAIVIVPLMASVPASLLWWIAAGGICYTAGTIFLVLDERVPYFHAVWHIWVMAGSACHFMAIYLYAVLGDVTVG